MREELLLNPELFRFERNRRERNGITLSIYFSCFFEGGSLYFKGKLRGIRRGLGFLVAIDLP